MNNHLHIISFDIPYPPNYGGIIDVFYKIKTLSEEGVKIILHCFEYNRERADILKQYCEKVYYYKRNTSLLSQASHLPYTVYSRKNNELISNLLKDNYPILFEGLMSCYYLDDKRLKDRFKIYRESNIEHDYYRELAKVTKVMKDKLYLYVEAFKLRFFEKQLKYADLMLVVSKDDQKQLQQRFPDKEIKYLPSFHSENEITSVTGSSDYILYNGNLGVVENEAAAIYLCQNVFKYLNCKCIIAGRNPSDTLKYIVSLFSNISLEADLSMERMNYLIQNAHIHLLITFQGTGLKLKLLNTLFAGRHVVVNNTMLAGTDLASICHVANKAEEQIKICEQLLKTPFTEEEINKRKKILFPQFSNKEQGLQIKKIISDK